MYSYRPHDWLVGSRSQNPVQMYFSGLDAMSRGFGPMTAIARIQVEQMAQASRLAQAYIDFASHLARSQSPQDGYAAQTKFWQTAMTQYQISASQVMESWAKMLVPLAGPVLKAHETGRPNRAIAFPAQRAAVRGPASGTQDRVAA